MPETNLAKPSVDPARVRELKDREDARFQAEHPRCARGSAFAVPGTTAPFEWSRRLRCVR